MFLSQTTEHSASALPHSGVCSPVPLPGAEHSVVSLPSNRPFSHSGKHSGKASISSRTKHRGDYGNIPGTACFTDSGEFMIVLRILRDNRDTFGIRDFSHLLGLHVSWPATRSSQAPSPRLVHGLVDASGGLSRPWLKLNKMHSYLTCVH